MVNVLDLALAAGVTGPELVWPRGPRLAADAVHQGQAAHPTEHLQTGALEVGAVVKVSLGDELAGLADLTSSSLGSAPTP